VKKSFLARWRTSFLTGLVITLPAIISLAAVKWLFGTVSSFTDALLFFCRLFCHPGPFTKTASPARCSGIGACWRCCWRWR
jgi:hypothetical protein